MEQNLIVKFPWSLRPKSKDRSGQVNEVKEKPVSRNTLYVRKLKKEKSEKYESILKKERIRAKEKYVKVAEKSEIDKQTVGLKWAQQKANQRKRKKDLECQGTSNESQQKQPPRKKVKEMSMEERKEYERNKNADS